MCASVEVSGDLLTINLALCLTQSPGMSPFLAEWLKTFVRALIEKGNLVDLEGLPLLVVVSLFSV